MLRELHLLDDLEQASPVPAERLEPRRLMEPRTPRGLSAVRCAGSPLMPAVSINKSMDRADLLTEPGQRFVAELNRLVETLQQRRLPVTSWTGGLPKRGIEGSLAGIKAAARRFLSRLGWEGAGAELNRGGSSYEPLPGSTSDPRHPWFVFWEAYWVMAHGPELSPRQRILDAGGTASLFSCLLASLGPEVDSVDLNDGLVTAGSEIARVMGWNLKPHCMDMTDLDFDDSSFDHAYSICVFEHLDSRLRQKALREIARVLKPGGMLSLTFDYRGPGVYLSGKGLDYDPENLICTPEDVERHFFSSGCLEPVGNPRFEDNGKSYLIWPSDRTKRYTFGAAFLRKTG